MKHQEFLEQFMHIVSHLSMLSVICDAISVLKEDSGYYVKNKGGIMSIINICNIKINLVLSTHSKFPEDVHESMREWIDYFVSEYAEEDSSSKKPALITIEDAKKLKKDVDWWREKIENHYTQPNTKLLKEIDFEKFFPFKLRKGIGRGINSDLREGFELLGINSPTAASMMLLRATEGIIKKYYKDKTGKNSRKKLNDLINDLEENYNIKKSTFGYLHYLREKRNDALHPGKIFKQEEAERVLINIKGLLEEIK